MKLIADENIDGTVVAYLRTRGHDTLWIVEHSRGMRDEEILQLATDQHRMVVTFDRDFGELVFHHGLKIPGVVLMRFGPVTPDELMRLFSTIWPKIEAAIPGHFIVATDRKIRVRPLL